MSGIALAAPGLAPDAHAAALAQLEGIGPVSVVDPSSPWSGDQAAIHDAHAVVVDEKGARVLAGAPWAGLIAGPIVVVFPESCGGAELRNRLDLVAVVGAADRAELDDPHALALAVSRVTA